MALISLTKALQLAGRAARGVETSMENLLRHIINGDVPFQGDTVVGSTTGTGSTIEIVLGFVPDHVMIFNDTDRDIFHEWWKGMTDGYAIEHKGAAAGTNFQVITSGGISELDSGGSKGFKILQTVSEDGKTLRYKAVRNKITT